MLKRITYPFLTIMIALALVVGISTVAHAKSTTETKGGIGDKLVPRPHQIKTGNGELQVRATVNILGEGTADKDAVAALKKFLDKSDITVLKEFDESAATIALGEKDNLAPEVAKVKKQLNLPASSTIKTEGYQLAVQSKANDVSKAGVILLEGADQSGTFYGIKTLIQMAKKQDDTLFFQNAHITDEPSMTTRGIIEGFYGEPWSQQDRLDQIQFYGDYKMNTYIYAPKDDPYHREKWREPYPESEMDRMEELIQTAKENKVDFVFAISPGIDIHFDGQKGEKDFQALMKKSESLYEMGVRSFAILFDDINNRDGVKQSKLLNRFNKEFFQKKKDVKPLMTVPTEYNTHAMGQLDDLTAYTKGFSSNLDKDIQIMWTGKDVVSENLPLENVDFMHKVYGDRIGIWWNYPVSDYLKSKLALGPIVDIDRNIEGKVNFFTMNPMEHANLSKISLATGGDFAWNTSEYNPNQSWNRSIELLFGGLATEMKTFANHSSHMTGNGIGREDAGEIRKVMNIFWSKLSKRKDTTQEEKRLNEAFSNMVKAANTLKKELPKKTLKESSANLDKLHLLGENDKKALQLALAKQNNDDDKYKKLKKDIENNMSALNSGARVSEKTALAFIEEALAYDPLPVVSFEVSKTLIAPGEEVQFKNMSSQTTDEIEWTFEGADKENSTEQNPKVTYEKEGIYSVKLVGKNPLGNDKVLKEGVITVTNQAKKGTKNLALKKRASASGFCADSEKPEFAVDGNTNTKWCANNGKTHTLTVDLGDTNLVSEIVIKHSEAGGEPSSSNTQAYHVQISKDGENFTDLVKVKDNKKGITKDQVTATKGRYVRLVVDKPTQGDDNAARIYEFEARGLAGDVALPPVYDPENPPVDSVFELKSLVDSFAESGAVDKKAAHLMTLHLTTVIHYEKNQKTEKVIHHLKGFQTLLEHQKKNDVISDKAYEVHTKDTQKLLKKWKKES